MSVAAGRIVRRVLLGTCWSAAQRMTMSRSRTASFDQGHRLVRFTMTSGSRTSAADEALGNGQCHRRSRTCNTVHDINRDLVGVRDDALGAQVTRRDDGGEAPLPPCRRESTSTVIDRQLDDHISRCGNVTEALREEIRRAPARSVQPCGPRGARIRTARAPRPGARCGPG